MLSSVVSKQVKLLKLQNIALSYFKILRRNLLADMNTNTGLSSHSAEHDSSSPPIGTAFFKKIICCVTHTVLNPTNDTSSLHDRYYSIINITDFLACKLIHLIRVTHCTILLTTLFESFLFPAVTNDVQNTPSYWHEYTALRSMG